jgi:hypothetical protein
MIEARDQDQGSAPQGQGVAKACDGETASRRMKFLSHRFYDLEQRRMKGPLAPAPLLIKPHAKQFLRAIVVWS